MKREIYYGGEAVNVAVKIGCIFMSQNYTTTGELSASPYPNGPSVSVPPGEALIHVMQGDLVDGEFQPNPGTGKFVFFKWGQSYYKSSFGDFAANTR